MIRRWSTRSRKPILALAIGGLVLSSGLVAAGLLGAFDSSEESPPRTITIQEASASFLAEGLTLEDRDVDDLPDVLENYVYGSDPDSWDTSGGGVPDGWLAEHGFPPTEAAVEARTAAEPPPESLPEPFRGEWPGEFVLTLKEVYEWNRPAGWNEEEDGPWRNGLDPRRWNNSASDVPDGWLIRHGLDPLQPGIVQQQLTSDVFTVLDDFRHGTDPRKADTDGDGLPDSEEVRIYRTDPLRPDSGRTGIPDGWLIRFGLNATNPSIGLQDPAGKGMTIGQVWEYNKQRFGADAALEGKGLVPHRTATLDGPIPDGWYVRYGLDPLEADGHAKTRWRASDWPDVRDLAQTEGSSPIPDLEWNLVSKYAYRRPASWNESLSGPWLGGLRPDTDDTDGDGLPDVVEARGWYVKRWTGLDPSAAPEFFRTFGDPTMADTDGDTLLDAEEYHGSASRQGDNVRFTPTDPANKDTAFSGLTDAEKLFGAVRDGVSYHFAEGGLTPARADSSGGLMRDGAALDYWHARYVRYLDGGAYEFTDSAHKTIGDLLLRDPRLEGRVTNDPVALARMFRPDGDLDADGVPNLMDPDADGDSLLNGAELRPRLLARHGPFTHAEAMGSFPRPATDPATPDTDGDELHDLWEIRYGVWVPALAQQIQEPGHPASAVGGWNLNPAMFASYGDGVSDAERNADGDTVVYYTYVRQPGGAVVRQPPHEFKFDNLQEFRAGTNPNMRDQDFDGVSEAWRIFWGRQYPLMLDEGDPEQIGTIVPETIDPALAQSIGAIAAGPLEDLELGAYEYKRFQEALGPAEEDVFPAPAPGERVARIYKTNDDQPIPVIRDGNQAFRYLARIEGRFVVDAPRAEQLGTNPYLETEDTDGDGLPDAWEAYYDCRDATGQRMPDPVAPDAHGDPDNDDLPTSLEYFLGSDPCNADTDAAGLTDGFEDTLGVMDPVDPTDDATILFSSVDTSGDGIPDAQKLLRGLNPFTPDHDGDGLIDGGSGDGGDLVLHSPASDARIEKLLAFGVGHRTQSLANGSVRYTFFSEVTLGTNPFNPDAAGTGIPEGWLRYYGYNPLAMTPTEADNVRPRYEWGRPSWWSEPIHGVWWWGRPPSPPPTLLPTDLDADGLNDLNGEDPTPFARHTWFRASTPATLRDAQAYGDCAGNPEPCRAALPSADYNGDGVPDLTDRVPVAVSITQVPSQVRKGDEFLVRGSVALACGGCTSPAPANRPVVLQLAQDNRAVIGVGVTDSSGAFEISACICGAREIDLPDGVPVLGRVEGPLSVDSSPGNVGLGGPKRIVAWTPNTTTTFFGAHDPAEDATHPQWSTMTVAGRAVHATAYAAATSTQTLEVRAGSRLTVALQTATVERGGTVAGTVTLTDSSGLPIQGTVTATWTGASGPPQTLTTGAQDGAAAFEFPANPAGGPGFYRLAFSYAGAPPLLTGNTTAVDVPVRFPTSLTATLPGANPRASLGQELRISGRIATSVGPVAGQVVRATLGGDLLGQSPPTSSDGTFTILTSPLGALTPGRHTINVAFAGTAALAPQAVALPFDMVAASILTLDPLPGLDVGSAIQLTGSLRRETLAPLPNQTVQLTIDGTTLGETQSDAAGVFRLEVPWPAAVGPGARRLVATFPGTDTILGSSNETWTLVASATVINLPLASAEAGRPVEVTGRLLRSDGQALVGQPVAVRFAGAPAGTAITDAQGVFLVTVGAERARRLGAVGVEATFEGGQEDLFLPARAQTTYLLKAGSRLDAVPANATRAVFPMSGTLVDGLGAPIGGAQVTLAVAGHRVLTRTNTAGQFEHVLTEGVDRPVGPVSWQASYEGNATLAPTQANATNLVRSSTRLSVVGPPDAGRGAPVNLSVRLSEDDGRDAADVSRLRVELGDRLVAAHHGLPNPSGVDAVIPPDAALGPQVLRIAFTGAEFLDPSASDVRIDIKERAELRLTPLAAEGGGPVPVRLELRDELGRPMGGQRVGVVTNAYGLPFLLTTNADGDAFVDLPRPEEGDLLVEARFLGSASHASAAAFVSVQGRPSARPLGTDALAAANHDMITLITATVAASLLLSIVYMVVWARPRILVLRSLDDAARRVEADDPYAASVLLAYKRLSTYVRQYGYVEEPGETAREFLGALHADLAVQADDAELLANLFDRARYGVHDMLGPSERLAAAGALRSLRDSIQQALQRTRAHGSRPRAAARGLRSHSSSTKEKSPQ